MLLEHGIDPSCLLHPLRSILPKLDPSSVASATQMVLLRILPRFSISRLFRKHNPRQRIPSTDTEHSDIGTNPEYSNPFEECFAMAYNDNPDEERYCIRSPRKPAYPLSPTYERYQNSMERFQKSLPEECQRRCSSWYIDIEMFIQFLQLLIDEYDDSEADDGPRGWPSYVKEVFTLLLMREFQDLDFRDHCYLRKQWEELVRLRAYFEDESRYKPEILGNLDIIIGQLGEFRSRKRRLGKKAGAPDEKLSLSSH